MAVRCVMRATLTPSVAAVCVMVPKMSYAVIPMRLRGPKLTSRLRTRWRAPNSAGLLCRGTSG